ncbi:hypothetical protein KUCAC02_011501 [Chaenocephalus aceratus]|uniref:Uncharacterized protein n=1 Tax=Chaenocephalus aceratus TaxID=36190 RepID=A0ACB9WWU4_CHAAC|nr:hypothetical protein KUCAC02_011501 [Chaenocephalus aceratus]
MKCCAAISKAAVMVCSLHSSGSSHNGPLTSGTILSDHTGQQSPASEEMLSSQSELRSSKCPQDRDSTYEVVKEMAVSSRDVSVEDSLYETVEGTQRAPPTAGPPQRPVEEPEEDLPPPLPSPLSPEPGFSNHNLSDNESAVYSTVDKTNCDESVSEEDKEHDYSSIAELKGLVPASSSSDLYATVRDIYAQPDEPEQDEEPGMDGTDPGYETIHIPKTSSSDDDRRAEGSDAAQPEPDYESVGEMGLSRETSRL